MAAQELFTTPLFNDANLVAYYRAENVNDSKGANTLTNNNSVAFNAAKFNNGADFGASNSTKFLDIASNLGIAGNGNLSVAFWFKCTGAPGSGEVQTLFHHLSTTTADRYIALKYFNDSGTLKLFIDSSLNTTSFNVDLGTSLFHHLALVRTGATATKLYLDGVDTGISLAQGTNAGGANHLYLGNEATINYTKGIIDDIAIFSKILTAAEVDSIYAGSKGAFLLNYL